MKLLLRFYDAEAGRIVIDGRAPDGTAEAIYVDGVQMASSSYSGAIDYAHQPDTVIGAIASKSGYFLDGALDALDEMRERRAL